MTHTRTHMAPELTGAGARWFKSSYSDGAYNNCVEVADLAETAYALHRDPGQQGLRGGCAACWSCIVRGVRPGHSTRTVRKGPHAAGGLVPYSSTRWSAVPQRLVAAALQRHGAQSCAAMTVGSSRSAGGSAWNAAVSVLSGGTGSFFGITLSRNSTTAWGYWCSLNSESTN